jgi:hypothetical protein
MATLTIRELGFTGLNAALQAASISDNFDNSGNVILFFQNTNASARTLTIAANDTNKQGFGDIVVPDTVVTLVGSGTNNGHTFIGVFPVDRFNDSNGRVNYTIDVITGLNVMAIRLK